MARPIKKGLDYFPFDVDFFADRKIRALKGKYGNDGVIIYIYLLTLIYNENGYYMRADDDLNYVLSDTFGASDEKIGQIVNFLLERSLFNDILFKSDKVLTSRSIQLRFQEAKKGAKREIEVDKRFWILTKNETQSFIKCTNFQGFSENNCGFSEKNPSKSEKNDTKKSKEKKRKVKERKEKNIPPGGGKQYNEPPVIALPLKDGDEFEIFNKDIVEWQSLYIKADITDELRKMRGWLLANEAKRKTRAGIKRFIANWLSKAHDNVKTAYASEPEKENKFSNPFLDLVKKYEEEERIEQNRNSEDYGGA